jgi:hypothetical protein
LILAAAPIGGFLLENSGFWRPRWSRRRVPLNARFTKAGGGRSCVAVPRRTLYAAPGLALPMAIVLHWRADLRHVETPGACEGAASVCFAFGVQST